MNIRAYAARALSNLEDPPPFIKHGLPALGALLALIAFWNWGPYQQLEFRFWAAGPAIAVWLILYLLPYGFRSPLEPIRNRPFVLKPDEIHFAQVWQEFAETSPSEFSAIFISLGQWKQRSASVAATFFCWLGSRDGQNYLARANTFLRTSPPGLNVHISVWSEYNRRRPDDNFAIRPGTLILDPDVRTDADYIGRKWDMSSHDLEVIDCLVFWLDTDAAGRLLDRAQSRRRSHSV